MGRGTVSRCNGNVSPVKVLTAGKAIPLSYCRKSIRMSTIHNIPNCVLSPTQFEAAQLHQLFDHLSDIQSENLTTLLSRFAKAVSKKSLTDAIYVHGFIAQVKNCLAPHAMLLQELSQHYYQVSLQDEKEVALC